MANQNLAGIKKTPKTGHLQQGICALFWSHSKTRKGFGVFSSSLVTNQNGQDASGSAQAGKVAGPEGTKKLEYNFLFLACSIPGHCFQYLFCNKKGSVHEMVILLRTTQRKKNA